MPLFIRPGQSGKNKGVKPLSWTRSSPEMSPIENVWGYICEKEARDAPTFTLELYKFVSFYWYNIDRTFHWSLYRSMAVGVADFVIINGWPNKMIMYCQGSTII